MSEFYKGEQRAWFHDEGHPAGFFHTYEALDIGGEPRKVQVFVPRDYEGSGTHYPVLYTNDGDTTFFPGGAIGLSWHMGETLSDLYSQNAIRKVIVVAVYPVDREKEYTHAPASLGLLNRKQSCCGVEEYANYLADKLKPFIDGCYRTLSQPQDTTILGASHGGLAAFYSACRRLEQFGNVAALSPSFWVGLDGGLGTFCSLANSKLLQLTGDALADREKRPRFWLDWGLLRNGGFHNWFIEGNTTKRGREMAKLLRDRYGYVEGEDLFVFEDAEGEHSETSWARRLPMALKALYGVGSPVAV